MHTHVRCMTLRICVCVTRNTAINGPDKRPKQPNNRRTSGNPKGFRLLGKGHQLNILGTYMLNLNLLNLNCMNLFRVNLKEGKTSNQFNKIADI